MKSLMSLLIVITCIVCAVPRQSLAYGTRAARCVFIESMRPTNDDDTLENSDEGTADIIINKKTYKSILLKLYLLKSRKE